MNALLLLAISLTAHLGVRSPATAASAQAPTVASVERPGDGQPTCGLGKSFHAGRRAALRERLKEGVVVVRGLPETRDYVAFRQDKVFWYLTGVESPSAGFAMDCASGREVLFLRADDRRIAGLESWEGEKWDAGDEWVEDLTGFAEVRSTDDLEAVLREMCAPSKKLWISTEPHVALSGCYDRAAPYDFAQKRDPWDGRISREKAFAEALQSKLEIEPESFTKHLDELRRVKTPEEVAAVRRASRAAALAMAEAMRSTAPGVGEWEIGALMDFWHVREGASGPGYDAIVGSGANSLVLHYNSSSRRMQAGEVVLVDYAPEVDHYVSDVTRTWPVDGKFSARQAELYDVVLEAQLAGIAAVKPGKSLRDIEAACADVIERHGFSNLVRHGVAHYVGMEVHDVGVQSKPFEPGVCFTVEPGLYEPSSGIGIRIEDVVCVTEKGCEVLSADVPKERAAVERLVRSEGVLDWLAKRRVE
jgi:Xaa-Pro aminopeptidase